MANKLVWHHGASVYWKIVALIVGSAEIERVRFILGCALPHPTLYGPYVLLTYACMHACIHTYIYTYIYTGLNIYTGPAPFLGLSC